MSHSNCILAIDQGTTSSRAIIFTSDGKILCSAQREFPQHYPNDGWVEHDPEDIWQSTLSVCKQVLQLANELSAQVVSIGITNQRETTVVWDRETGTPIYNAIVWQDRRTADICANLASKHDPQTISNKTGLLLDPYFSATKIAWILDNVDGARAKAESGKLAFGTIDTFLISRLTNGQVHATDVTNASRTNLYDIHKLQWDDELLAIFEVPASVLPEVKECADDYGITSEEVLGHAIPIQGVAGDQQAATIGQCCFNAGDIKSTYGTGCFVLLNTGEKVFQSQNKLLSTIAYQIKGQVHYALEGSIFIAGAAVQWLRDGIKIIQSAKDTEQMANSLPDDHGVFLVPAFAGLGAPYWQPNARAAVFGMTRGTDERYLARAALESVCFQTSDLLNAMKNDGVSAKSLNVDGGMVANDWVCQQLSNILGIPVARPHVMETTALGCAYLAAIQAGIYNSTAEVAKHHAIEKTFDSSMPQSQRDNLLDGWRRAVRATQSFSDTN